jgi:hypothetical protein
MMLALGPGQDLGDNAACGTVHTPSCVPEEDRESPKRNELKSSLRELVITRAALPTARAIELRALTGNHPDLDGIRFPGGESGVFVHKALEMITAIQ